MKVQQKTISDTVLRLEVRAMPQEVDQAFMDSQIEFAQQMNVMPEAHKTVAQSVEDKLGIQDLDAVVRAQVVDHLWPHALDKKNIVPAYPPEPSRDSLPRRGQEFSFSLDVTLKPEYELSSYEPVAFSAPALELDEREIDNQLAQMADSYASYVTDEPHPIAVGDSALLSMKSFEDGKPFPALTIEGRTYVAGTGLMPDSFDKNIIGMDVGETKTFSFSGPSVDAEGRETEQVIESTVTVKEIQKKVIPCIDDEWVQKNMPLFQDLAMMRAALGEQMLAAQKRDYDLMRRQLAATELAKRFEGKIADAIYEATQKFLLNNLKAEIQQQGMTFEQFVQQNGGEQQFSMMLMMQTRQNLVEGYALDALFRHENMLLNDEDIMEACKTMNPQQPQMVKDQMEKTGYAWALRESASRMKASRWLVEHATITVQEASA